MRSKTRAPRHDLSTVRPAASLAPPSDARRATKGRQLDSAIEQVGKMVQARTTEVVRAAERKMATQLRAATADRLRELERRIERLERLVRRAR